jgi:2',3'-cyclic-nucleotide 2'-phosphodiesterase/3'-nucleotidase
MREEGRNLLVVDAGNMLFRKPPTSQQRRKEALLKVDVLLRAYGEMGYSAVNIGEKDLTLGLGFLDEIAKEKELPLVSANLIDRKTKKAVFKPFITREIAGIKVGVIGLMSRWVNEVLKEKEPYLEVLDPLDAAKPYVEELRKSCDLVIVLSQLGERGDRELALKIPGIDIIVGGSRGERIRYSKIRETLMYRLEPRGGYLGKLDLSLARRGRPLQLTDYKKRQRIVKKVETIKKRWMEIEREIELGTEESPSKRDMRMKQLAILERRREELQQQVVAFDQKNLFKNEAIPIRIAIPDDPVIGKMIDGYVVELAELYGVKQAAKIGPEKLASEAEILASIPGDSAYRGALSCKKCHRRNFDAWSATAHARATQTISEAFKQRPPLADCLICHTTGYGDIKEYRFVEEVPLYLRGVQCEACHGSVKEHPGFGAKFRRVTLGICRNCHTKDQSPAFHYRSYLLRIGCTIRR